MLVWLVGLVGDFRLPLPSPCPMEFACMPEHFVEDAMELLIFASRIPKALNGVILVRSHEEIYPNDAFVFLFYLSNVECLFLSSFPG